MNRENTSRRKNTGRMFRTASAALLAASLLLGGCAEARQPAVSTQEESRQEETQAAIEYTVPPDGNPDDVTCRGSYTGTYDEETAVASLGTASLTNPQLNVFYRMAISGFRPEAGEPQPDWSIPLEGQMVPGLELTWQQYFLDQALESWHRIQALEQQSREPFTRKDLHFHPIPETHAKYMTDMPITVNHILYDAEIVYTPNKIHREYLDRMEDTLQEAAQQKGYADLEQMVRTEFGEQMPLEVLTDTLKLVNYAYMYFTERTYDMEPDPEEVEKKLTPGEDYVVDLRHMLRIPEGAILDDQGRVTATDEQWEACGEEMKKYLYTWTTTLRREHIFANQAHLESQDPYTALNGGLLQNIEKGQLTEPLDQWCFDPDRKPGDVEIFRTDFGWDMVYFSAKRDAGYEKTLSELRMEEWAKFVQKTAEDFPMEVQYEKIILEDVKQPGKVTLQENLLYPDIAHERFTEPIVYVQQDYTTAPYGGRTVSTHGCGITTMAMIATYMSDSLLTPGIMADRYGQYGSIMGTDGNIFWDVAPELGFYPLAKVFRMEDVTAALEKGYKVVSLQYKGYFTRGGHYLLLSELNDDGTVVIRDSNIYNYKRLPYHAVDAFPAKLIPQASQIFWVYDYKITALPNCIRCGDAPIRHELDLSHAPEMVKDYLCPKCRTAMDRRQGFLELTGMN